MNPVTVGAFVFNIIGALIYVALAHISPWLCGAFALVSGMATVYGISQLVK